jgi:hypothetical protein
MAQKKDVVLIVWGVDVIELMALALQDCHLTAVGLEPAEEMDRIEEFITSYDPSVIVFDLAPPYRRSAEAAILLLCRFPWLAAVFTCADRKLAQNQEPWLSCRPIFQKPYDIDAITGLIASLAVPELQTRQCSTRNPTADRRPLAVSSHAS